MSIKFFLKRVFISCSGLSILRTILKDNLGHIFFKIKGFTKHLLPPSVYNTVLDIVDSEVRQENNIRNGEEEMELS